MGQYSNPLYAGRDRMRGDERLMLIEGASVKHPSLISVYAAPAKSKQRETPLSLIGIDIETEHTSGKPMLLGVWRNGKYERYYAGSEPLFDALYRLLWLAKGDKKRGIPPSALACWRKFDGYALLRVLLEHGQFSSEEVKRICTRLDKIEGKPDPKKPLEWIIKPPLLIETTGRRRGMRVQVGVKRAIRSSLELFVWNAGFKTPFTVWLYDISSFYNRGLASEAGERYDWYAKIDESAHLVDWSRFERDTTYQNDIVLKSNALDARAAAELGLNIQGAFYNLLGVYPRSLISTGGLGRLAARTLIERAGDIDGYESLSIFAQLQDWNASGHIEDILKRAYHLTVAAYSGGMIEALQLGSARRGAVADIASAYPSVIVKLRDLRGSNVTTGSGIPPIQTETRYVFVEGTVSVPNDPTILHTITIRDDVKKQVNQRPQGTFRAVYTEHERAFAAAQGVTFADESWIAIACEDRRSPLANANQQLVELRAALKARGDSGEYAAKIAANSQYGITYEAVPLYAENDSEMLHDGYRAGEMFNPIIAALITSETRITLATAALAIQQRGGVPIILMTDSVVWTAPDTMSDAEMLALLPAEMWREKKTLGYFEKPEIVRDVLCVAPGRYEYIKGDTLVMKTLGFTVERTQNGVTLTNEFSLEEPDGKGEASDTAKQGHYCKSWREMLQEASEDADELLVQTRRLISPGMLAMGQTQLTELGLVRDVSEWASLKPQWLKREVRGAITAGRLLAGLTPTLKPNAQMTGRTPDGTLAKLWNTIEAKPLFVTEEARIQRRERERAKKARKREREREAKRGREAAYFLSDYGEYCRRRERTAAIENIQDYARIYAAQRDKEERRKAQNRERQRRFRAKQQQRQEETK